MLCGEPIAGTVKLEIITLIEIKDNVFDKSAQLQMKNKSVSYVEDTTYWTHEEIKELIGS